jgi:hypothetical protein
MLVLAFGRSLTKLARRLRTTEESTPPDIATWTIVSFAIRLEHGGGYHYRPILDPDLQG